MTEASTQAMTQVMTRVDRATLAELDRLVAKGKNLTRSKLVRAAIEAMLVVERRASEDAAIVEAYTRRPQVDDDLAFVVDAGRDTFAALDAEEDAARATG